MLRNDIVNAHFFSTRSCNHNKCTCFNSIWNNFMETAHQIIYAINCDNICTSTSDFCTHFVQQCCNVNNLWFFCGIFNRCSAFCINCSHHNIDCCSYRCNIQENLSANQFFRSDVIASLFKFHFCTKCFKSFNMKINWTRAKIAATWHFHSDMAILSKKCSHEVIGSSQFCYCILNKISILHICWINNQMIICNFCHFNI